MLKSIVKFYNVEKAKHHASQMAIRFVWELFHDAVRAGGILNVVEDYGFQSTFTDIGEGQITKQLTFKGMKGNFIIELDGDITAYVRDFRKKDPNSYVLCQLPKEFIGQYRLFRDDVVQKLMRG